MSRKCDLCGKGLQYGNRVSHAKNRTKHIFRPNLKSAKIMVNGVIKKMKLCTKCLRSAKKGKSR